MTNQSMNMNGTNSSNVIVIVAEAREAMKT